MYINYGRIYVSPLQVVGRTGVTVTPYEKVKSGCCLNSSEMVQVDEQQSCFHFHAHEDCNCNAAGFKGRPSLARSKGSREAAAYKADNNRELQTEQMLVKFLQPRGIRQGTFFTGTPCDCTARA